jgi:hypothetical protein
MTYLTIFISEKTTQIYLDSFENSQIDEAMKNLL